MAKLTADINQYRERAWGREQGQAAGSRNWEQGAGRSSKQQGAEWMGAGNIEQGAGSMPR